MNCPSSHKDSSRATTAQLITIIDWTLAHLNESVKVSLALFFCEWASLNLFIRVWLLWVLKQKSFSLFFTFSPFLINLPMPFTDIFWNFFSVTKAKNLLGRVSWGSHLLFEIPLQMRSVQISSLKLSGKLLQDLGPYSQPWRAILLLHYLLFMPSKNILTFVKWFLCARTFTEIM